MNRIFTLYRYQQVDSYVRFLPESRIMPENSAEVNVSVAVRIRPLLPKEKLASEQSCVRIVPSSNQLILGKDRAFTFDCILSSKTTQDEVYKRCVSGLVKGCFEGYNATVFAYGQTGKCLKLQFR